MTGPLPVPVLAMSAAWPDVIANAAVSFPSPPGGASRKGRAGEIRRDIHGVPGFPTSGLSARGEGTMPPGRSARRAAAMVGTIAAFLSRISFSFPLPHSTDPLFDAGSKIFPRN
ncbi:hypothetical protein [Streptomyces yunnanensis]|uniref:hypothetical protein n=1 Tax=Streptomyces yunnanensis TaxID=156453 RepID=UPI00142E25B0|nr:hypothetical protein [Streptomyces yunnanensis]